MEHVYHTIVLGAGQAGLAAGYYLQKAGRDFLILEANDRVGDGWRRRWKGLRLFSPQRYNGLPGLAPAGDDWYLPSRLEIADYLENYARHFALPVRNRRTCVRAAKEAAGHWLIETDQETFCAQNVVVATGAYRTPQRPAAVVDTFPATIDQLHSSEVREPDELARRYGSILFVGAGASGQQLARACAAAGAEVILAGPKVGNLPRHILGRDVYWWMYKSGLMGLRTDRPPGSLMASPGGDVTVGEPPLPAGVRRVETELIGYRDGALRWRCQSTAPEPTPWPAAGHAGLVVWCTGYHNAYPFLPTDLLNEDGRPRRNGAISAVDPSVVYLGLPNLRRVNSGLMGGVGADAGAVLGS